MHNQKTVKGNRSPSLNQKFNAHPRCALNFWGSCPKESQETALCWRLFFEMWISTSSANEHLNCLDIAFVDPFTASLICFSTHIWLAMHFVAFRENWMHIKHRKQSDFLSNLLSSWLQKQILVPCLNGNYKLNIFQKNILHKEHVRVHLQVPRDALDRLLVIPQNCLAWNYFKSKQNAYPSLAWMSFLVRPHGITRQ